MDELNNENLPIRRLEETGLYSKYYDDNRFWRKVRCIARKAGTSVLRPVLLLYYIMKSEHVLNRKYSSTGLGLAISKNIITMMRGKIEIKNNIPAGSIF